MALFNFKKRDRVLDLTEKYKKKLEAETKPEASLKNTSSQTESPGFNFLGNMASGIRTTEDVIEDEGFSVADEKKKKLAKRLIDMTSKVESLSNQIYHLQQRIEVLERKSGIRIE